MYQITQKILTMIFFLFGFIGVFAFEWAIVSGLFWLIELGINLAYTVDIPCLIAGFMVVVVHTSIDITKSEDKKRSIRNVFNFKL